MIEKRLGNLKRIINEIDEQKMQNSQKIDSISLISLNLSRVRKTQAISYSRNQQPISFDKTAALSFPELMSPSKLSKNVIVKTQSLMEPSHQKSPRLLLKYINQTNKNKLTSLAEKLYLARITDMDIKQSQVGWQQFLKIFLNKNSVNGQFKGDRLILSGLGLMKNSFVITNEVLSQFKIVDLSRNIIRIQNIPNIKITKRLQELVLKNCDMKNEQLCQLFTILLDTPIKSLNISSPDIKDRNNLTKYSELYKLIQDSSTLQSLQLSNIQISPSCQIFAHAKKSKTLKRLNLSKNTGVVGICKNIQQLNLSWNGISKPSSLKALQCNLLRLDLTGNPIPCYLFEEFFNTSCFPILKWLILNKISINSQGVWLQTYIQKTKSLQSLQMVECDLSKTTFLNVVYGLENNKSIKSLNLSGNKLPSSVAQHFTVSLQKSNVSHLYLSLCDIKDACGAILFEALRKNSTIEYIDVSKNNLGQKTSQTICECLKKGCFNLLQLITTQNFIKYDQLKEITGYINRNVYMAKVKIFQQHRKYKNMSSSNTEMIRKVQDAQQKIQILRDETLKMEDIYMSKQKQKQAIEALILEQKIRLLAQEESKIQNKMKQLIQNKSNSGDMNPELQF